MNEFDITCAHSDGVDEWLAEYLGRHGTDWGADTYNLIGFYRGKYEPEDRSRYHFNRYVIFDDHIAMMFKLAFSDVIHK